MPAHPLNLTIEQGATFRFQFTWRADSVTTPGEPGDPIDLTDAVIRMQIRKSQQAPVLAEARSDGVDPDITHNGAGGRIMVRLPPAKTNLLTSKSAQYDLEVEMADGDVYRVIEGTVTVKPNITQTADEPVVTQ